jgi:hypothetical protein
MKDLLKSQTHHYVLAGLLALFVILDIKVPDDVKPLLNSLVGKAVVIICALSLLSVNVLVGVLALIASFELLRRAGSPINIPQFMPNLDFSAMTGGNGDDEGSSKIAGNTGAPLPTLEENVVGNMLPRTSSDAYDSAPFKPVQNSVHAAGKL